MIPRPLPILALLVLVPFCGIASDDKPEPSAARITGDEPGWKPLLEADFAAVNSAADTWTFDDENHLIHCTGQPISVIRTVKKFANFELIMEWQHLEAGGNSGLFVWSGREALDALSGPGLPRQGIEVQILDPGFRRKFRERNRGSDDWFTCHGDVFAVGRSSLEPFPPLSPNGSRSFPTARTTRPNGHWNHYYVRAINGEIRLWVNGVEVSGGRKAEPASGHLCLESEGAPIKFRHLRIRSLP